MGTGLDYHIIDADSHLSEDLNRVQELTDARYREFAPKMLPQGPSEVFVIGGKYLPQPPGMTWGETISPGGFRKTPRTPTKYADGDVVGFDPKARLEMMDDHGVFGSVIFPSQGLFAGAIPEPKMAGAVCRGVNRYMAEFCSEDPTRLWNMATVPVSDVDIAIAEAKYAVKELGAVGIFSPSGVHGPHPIYHAYYDPFFDSIAELDVPYCAHTGAAVFAPKGLAVERFDGAFPPYHMTTHVCEAMITSVGIITYGVIDKRPELKVGFFEAGAGWAPFWVSRMQDNYHDMGWMMPELKRDPLETFKNNCLVTVEAEEAILEATLEYFDGNSVAWTSDVPHFDCENEGRPDELVENTMLSQEAKKSLLHENAIEFFGLKIPKLNS